MPSFRSPEKLAKNLVIKKVMHGKSRHTIQNAEQNFIASLGTENKYKGNIKRFIEWLQQRRIFVENVTIENALEFLNHLSDHCAQKTLDGYRQAIDLVFGMEISYVRSKKISQLFPRAYRIEQISMLAKRANDDLNLSIRISAHAGLRAIELDSLSLPDEVQENNRAWLNERFHGVENEIPYVVVGKGGLRRKIFLSQQLSFELEKIRLNSPTLKRQRGINYVKRYSLIGGHSFSLQFSRLSKKLFGWSTGAHGLRHHYAQQRMIALQRHGFIYEDALKILSQEMGHFSTKNTRTYMR